MRVPNLQSVSRPLVSRPLVSRPRVSRAPLPRVRSWGASLRHLAGRAHLGRRALTLTTGLAAATPVIVSTVNATKAGWIPGDDKAIIAVRAHDVLTSHTPLVGQYTLAGKVTGHVTHSLGPMLFWLLALPANFGSTASLIGTMGAVNTLAIIGAVALARRRGGLVLMFAAALAIALMCQSLAAETFHDVWNPSAGLFPFTLLIFLCWSLACGEYRLLPLTVLVASFVVQAHLMYLPPTIGLLAVGFGGLALARLGRARDRKSGRPILRWGLAALAVAAVCWSAPVVGQLTEHPGNISLVVETATAHKATLGASAGWHAVVRAVGIRPWWLYIPTTRWDRKYDVRSTPTTSEVDSCLALLGALLLTLLVGLAVRRRDVASAALIGFALCAGLAAVAASTPLPRVLSATLGYTMWWGSQVGMWVYLILAWSLWLALAWAVRRLAPHARRLLARARARASASARRSRAAPRFSAPVRVLASALACLVALGAVLAAGSAVASNEKPDEHAALYRPTAALATRLNRVIPPGATVELEGKLGVATLGMKPALRYFLVRHGVRVLGRGSYLRLGTYYELYDRPFNYIASVDDGTRPPVPRARLIGRERFPDPYGPQLVSLWALHVRGRGGSWTVVTPPRLARAHASPHGRPLLPGHLQ